MSIVTVRSISFGGLVDVRLPQPCQKERRVKYCCRQLAHCSTSLCWLCCWLGKHCEAVCGSANYAQLLCKSPLAHTLYLYESKTRVGAEYGFPSLSGAVSCIADDVKMLRRQFSCGAEERFLWISVLSRYVGWNSWLRLSPTSEWRILQQESAFTFERWVALPSSLQMHSFLVTRLDNDD